MHRNKPCYPYKRNNSVGVLHLLGLVYKQMGTWKNDPPFPCHPPSLWCKQSPDDNPIQPERFRSAALRCSGWNLRASCAEEHGFTANHGTRRP